MQFAPCDYVANASVRESVPGGSGPARILRVTKALDGDRGLDDLPPFLTLDVELDLSLVDIEVFADDGDQFLLHLLHDGGLQLGTVLH